MSNARNIASIAGEDVLNASNEIVPVYACRAAVYIEYDTSAVTTKNNNTYLNVSSVVETTNDGNKYTVNFTRNMPHTHYIAVIGSGRFWNSNQKNLSLLVQGSDMTRTVSAVEFGNVYANTGSEPLHNFNVAIFC